MHKLKLPCALVPLETVVVGFFFFFTGKQAYKGNRFIKTAHQKKGEAEQTAVAEVWLVKAAPPTQTQTGLLITSCQCTQERKRTLKYRSHYCRTSIDPPQLHSFIKWMRRDLLQECRSHRFCVAFRWSGLHFQTVNKHNLADLCLCVLYLFFLFN